MFDRHALAQSSSDYRVAISLKQRDFEELVADSQPTGLIGVDLFKSSIIVAAVGGLQHIRTVLKVTFDSQHICMKSCHSGS